MRTEDGSIIYECLNGKPEAFGILVDKYKAGIYAFVCAEVRNFHDAQDVTQEIFIQAYRDLRSLRRWESFAFWLYRIAYTRCRKRVRSRSRRPDSAFVEDQDPKVLEKPSLDAYRDSRVNESLQEALDSLSEIYREVLMLHYFGGMTIKDMARAIGVSPAAIGKRLSRARSQLREEMVAMMSTAFEEQRLQASFTFRVVEAVKRIKINPMPRVAGLPWGLSLAVGIIITAIGLNPYLSMPRDMAMPTASPLPVETKVLKTGEINVDILKTSEISVISSKRAGGDEGKPQNPQSAFFLAPQQDEGGTWTQKAKMLTGRHMLSTCALDGKVYAIGGCTNKPGELFSAVEEYDPKTDTWAKKADMLTARLLDNAASVVNGKIYAIGGGTNRVLPNVEEYNPKTDTWKRKADMPTARCHMTTCAVNGKIYAIGGCINPDRFTSVVEEYDPETDTWTRKADMPTVRAAHDSAAVNGKIYVVGGSEPPWGGGWEGNLSTVEEYDPETDTWTKKADMSGPRGGLAVCALGGKIYAISGGGVRPDGKGPPFKGATELVEEYDPATDTWTRKADIPTRRRQLSACAVNGKIYAIGGSLKPAAKPSTFYSIVEEYTPEGWRPESVSPQGKLPTTWGKTKHF